MFAYHSTTFSVLKTLKHLIRTYSQGLEVVAPRTLVSNPNKHDETQLGLWYTVDVEVAKQLFSEKNLPRTYTNLASVFGETAFMIREPSIRVINYIKQCDLFMPPNKFIFYGEIGSGKSMCMAHVLHFLYNSKWIIFHVPWITNWRRRFKEISGSVSTPGRYDHTVDAVIWLQHFKNLNGSLIKEYDLKTLSEHNWTKREKTEAGAPLFSIIEQGLQRARLASDCVCALAEELKQHACAGRCQVAIMIDGINALFSPKSQFRNMEDITRRIYVEPQKFTLYQAFLNFISSDWNNGVIVGTVDAIAADKDQKESYMPYYLLQNFGWEKLDPFVPVSVQTYNEHEMKSAIDYYLEKKWLQNPTSYSETGRKELATLSGGNGYALMKYCEAL